MKQLLACGLLAAMVPAQAVLQVGPGGHAQIGDAIAVAQPGDVVEVATGTYQPFTLDKALVVRAAPGATVVVLGGINVQTLLRPPLGQVAHLGRIQFLNPWQFFVGAETIADRGTVWCEDCVFEAAPHNDSAGLAVRGGTVVLRRCSVVANGWAYTRVSQRSSGLTVVAGAVFAADSLFAGGYTGFDSLPAGVGLAAQDAVVHLVDCQVFGGGALGTCFSTVPGHGMTVAGSSDITLSDCAVTGGASTCAVGAVGLFHAGTSPARQARCTFLGGLAANGRGLPVVGNVQSVPLLGAVGDTVPLVRGAAWQADWRTEPNWPVGVFLGDQLGPHGEPAVAGPVLLAPGRAVALALLVADAQGAATYTTQLPAIPAALGATLFVTAVTGVTTPLRTAPPVGGLLW